MVMDSTYSPLQLDGIIWEEDSIAYGCENATLVLNNQKGLLRKNYACLESGHYQTPDGKDTPWPVCTTKPTDPCEFIIFICLPYLVCPLLRLRVLSSSRLPTLRVGKPWSMF